MTWGSKLACGHSKGSKKRLSPSMAWAPASLQMTDRDLDWSQLAQTAIIQLLKGFRGYKSKRFIDICFAVN